MEMKIKELEEVAALNQVKYVFDNKLNAATVVELRHLGVENFKDGANWKKNHLWKDAQGDDLPEIGREVIALQGRKVVFAHRPPAYWDGKNIDAGEVTRHYPQTYDKGGWNMEGVTYWLDAPLPEGIE